MRKIPHVEHRPSGSQILIHQETETARSLQITFPFRKVPTFLIDIGNTSESSWDNIIMREGS